SSGGRASRDSLREQRFDEGHAITAHLQHCETHLERCENRTNRRPDPNCESNWFITLIKSSVNAKNFSVCAFVLSGLWTISIIHLLALNDRGSPGRANAAANSCQEGIHQRMRRGLCRSRLRNVECPNEEGMLRQLNHSNLALTV